jgi:hypothetical protein
MVFFLAINVPFHTISMRRADRKHSVSAFVAWSKTRHEPEYLIVTVTRNLPLLLDHFSQFFHSTEYLFFNAL